MGTSQENVLVFYPASSRCNEVVCLTASSKKAFSGYQFIPYENWLGEQVGFFSAGIRWLQKNIAKKCPLVLILLFVRNRVDRAGLVSSMRFERFNPPFYRKPGVVPGWLTGTNTCSAILAGTWLLGLATKTCVHGLRPLQTAFPGSLES